MIINKGSKFLAFKESGYDDKEFLGALKKYVREASTRRATTEIKSPFAYSSFVF